MDRPGVDEGGSHDRMMDRPGRGGRVVAFDFLFLRFGTKDRTRQGSATQAGALRWRATCREAVGASCWR